MSDKPSKRRDLAKFSGVSGDNCLIHVFWKSIERRDVDSMVVLFGGAILKALAEGMEIDRYVDVDVTAKTANGVNFMLFTDVVLENDNGNKCRN